MAIKITFSVIFLFILSDFKSCIQFCYCAKPNFLFILTDDQDTALGGLFPMQKSRSLLGAEGAEFINMFVTTPLCCPSRASILTGRYAHNHGVVNNSVSGNCNSYAWQKDLERNTFVTYLKKDGYSTFYAGKYLNQYGNTVTGGVKHVPVGWDHWFALVGNSCYYNYSLSVNGKRVRYGSDPDKDYLTHVIINKAIDFVLLQNQTTPFFMFLSPPAPHSPFTPAPQYKDAFSNFSAPRTPNFGIHVGKDKHWLLRQPPSPLPNFVIEKIDEVFRNRWRTLLSVDDGIYKIYSMLKKKNLLDNTYIFLTSDNGFHLGQFSLPWDKRQPYEFDVRVPMLVRGPGIQARRKVQNPVLNIDLAPTVLNLANITIPEEFDGESFATVLKSSVIAKRSSFIIEHKGEANDKVIPGCPQYKVKEVNTCEIDCICEDSRNNSYTCVRHLTKEENSLTCLFKDSENFVEAYNLTEDPFQLKNIFSNSKMSDLLSTVKLMDVF